MIGFLLKVAFNCLLLACGVYVVFFVPLGERTIYQHLAAIAATEPAQEFASEIGDLASQAQEGVTRQVRQGAGEGPPAAP